MGRKNKKEKKKQTKQTTDLFIFIPRECFRGEDKPEIFRSTFHETDIVESQPAPAYDLKEKGEKIMNVKYYGETPKFNILQSKIMIHILFHKTVYMVV